MISCKFFKNKIHLHLSFEYVHSNNNNFTELDL